MSYLIKGYSFELFKYLSQPTQTLSSILKIVFPLLSCILFIKFGLIFFPPLTKEEYAEEASKFYKFTPETMETAFKLFNTWPNSYYNVCGPFICKNNRWFPIYSKKYIDTIKLAEENTNLREKIKELEAKLATKDV